jgi:Spy/CpxP family protein refolding chaperone
MKKALLLLTLVAPALALSQEPPRPGPDPFAEHLFPPELIMQNQRAIGLEEDQKARIREEIGRAQSRFTELQWNLQDAMESLVSLVKESRVDEDEALARLDEVLAAEREIKRAQIALLLRIKNSLTEEQQERLRGARGGSR